MCELRFGMVVVICVRETETKLYNFRPSESISPKRKLQNQIIAFGSRNSLRRPGSRLSDLVSRLGKSGSPKRDRDEACMCWARILVQARSFVCWAN